MSGWRFALAALMGAAGAAAQVPGTAPAAHMAGGAVPAGPRTPVPLPPLPLPTGARVMGLGHSFIQRGAFNYVLASQTETGGNIGPATDARAVLTHIAAEDGRFNLDVFADTSNRSGFRTVELNGLSGAVQGIGGEHLERTSAVPGTLWRTAYILARNPAIIYLDIGSNDINSGVSGTGRPADAAEVIAALDRQIALLTAYGKHVVVQTLAWRFDWPAGDDRYATLQQVNAWIVAQAGRPGVQVCDTIALDGTAATTWGTLSTTLMADRVHLTAPGAKARTAVLLPILQGMVAPSEPRNLDPLSANLFPRAGLPGTSGTAGVRVTGPIATGMTALMQTGASTVMAAKEVVSTGNERQVFTVTPIADGTETHELRFQPAAFSMLSAMGIAAGDWLEAYIPVTFDGWAGWDQAAFGAASMHMRLTNGTNAPRWNTQTQGGRTGRTVVLSAKVWVPSGLADPAQRFAFNNMMLRIFWPGAATGSGTVKVGSPIVRKIGDPRTAWNLP